VKAYDKTTHDGKTVDWHTKAALLLAEDRLGYELTITQGSYNADKVAASAGTHAGGGVVDLAPADAANKVLVLRRIGFAAWHRTPDQGDWPEHIHAVLIGNDKLSDAAQAQVSAYLNNKNGLANNGHDDGPAGLTTRRFHFDRVAQARILLHLARTARKGTADADRLTRVLDRLAGVL
jgi:hypothetical protein